MPERWWMGVSRICIIRSIGIKTLCAAAPIALPTRTSWIVFAMPSIFVESTGVRGTAALKTVELFCSHEGLLLDYEAALTEQWASVGIILARIFCGLATGPPAGWGACGVLSRAGKPNRDQRRPEHGTDGFGGVDYGSRAS